MRAQNVGSMPSSWSRVNQDAEVVAEALQEHFVDLRGEGLGAHRSTELAATMRLVALRAAGSISGAAELLGMAPVSLRRWIRRRSPVLGQAPAFWGKWRF